MYHGDEVDFAEEATEAVALASHPTENTCTIALPRSPLDSIPAQRRWKGPCQDWDQLVQLIGAIGTSTFSA